MNTSEDIVFICDFCGEEFNKTTKWKWDTCCSENCYHDLINESGDDPEYYDDRDYDDDHYMIDGVGFADPHSSSALRAETEDNPRDRPCPTCHATDVLTRIDVANHYQCDACANALEYGRDRGYVCNGVNGGCEICKSYEDEESDEV